MVNKTNFTRTAIYTYTCILLNLHMLTNVYILPRLHVYVTVYVGKRSHL